MGFFVSIHPIRASGRRNAYMDTSTFYTRTERRTADHPGVNDWRIIGMDYGYSSVKGCHKGGFCCFPSYCKEMKTDVFGQLKGSDIIYTDLDTGKRYQVGALAAESLTAGETVSENAFFGRNHYLSPEFLVLVRTGLAFALWNYSKTDGSDLFIQSGLPPAYLSADTPYLVDVIGREHHFQIENGPETRTFHFKIPQAQIDVMNQPMGTLYSMGINEKGKITSCLTKLLQSDFLILDGGFGTLDLFLIRSRTVATRETSPELGMRRILEEARNRIKKEVGVEVSIPGMQNCLKTGKVKYIDRTSIKAREVAIDRYVEEANTLVCEEAFETIKDHIFDIDYLIMTGGTGILWYPAFQERLSGVESLQVLPGNANMNGMPCIYANARGYYMYRLNALLRNGKA
jgi:plasmid segregation protein ParM